MFKSILLIFIFAAGCKTAEQIKREKMVNNLSVQMTESQKLSTDYIVRLHNLETQISEMKGEIEESRHLSKERFKDNIKKIEEDVRLAQENQKAFNEFMEKQDKENKEHNHRTQRQGQGVRKSRTE